nr:MAG TPA: nicotinate phosphoribosyltransferase [Bacteriophage sp.]
MIIKSILDTDLYKFTTSYAYMKLFPNAIGTFTFVDRDKTKYTDEFVREFKMELCNMSRLALTLEESMFMSKCRFIPKMYWEWLSSFRFDPNKVNACIDVLGNLHIEVTDHLYKATLYEVPILALVSELRNKMLGYTVDINEVIDRLIPKIKLSNEYKIKFSEFGTRRRFNFNVQKQVVDYIAHNSQYCTGTSNCYLAMKYGMKPMGTHPHEWFMFHGAQFGYKHANYMALENWVNVYDGDLGIALTDTYTSNVFFNNFSRKHAKLFDGIRQDSGDEYQFVMKVIARYKMLGVDPSTKTIVFSNALDFEKAKDINEYCRGRINASFGIGTNLTNDTGNPPANIVMKLSSCQMSEGKPIYDCVKLSDDMGKHHGKEQEVTLCVKELNL